jgi:hypothetical protein
MNLRNLNELEVWEQYQIKISNRFATLENLSDGEDINRAWKNIKGTEKKTARESLGLHQYKQHKPWLMKMLRFLDQGCRLKCRGYRVHARAT